MKLLRQESGYTCWLRCEACRDEHLLREYRSWCGGLQTIGSSEILKSAQKELLSGIAAITGQTPTSEASAQFLLLGVLGQSPELTVASAGLTEDGYLIRTVRRDGQSFILLAGKTDKGALYAAFHFLRLLQTGEPLGTLDIAENPKNRLRMINQWDNMDGSIERGYAGRSIFYENHDFIGDLDRIRDYARLLASTGINAIAINNVNVHRTETKLITSEWLPEVARVAGVFREYGIRTFLSINFAGPIEIGGLATADPLDGEVRCWWADRAADIYRHIPDFGGFLVKADSEFRPGPFTYGRDHADGANMLAEALQPYGGLVIWRCFVYNCLQDWRDRSTDRARAAYDHFTPLDGRFLDNVILQIKNGPMDFQVREPVSPLFGGMTKTNQMLELQITQEYTGQQKHLCYLVPQWKEVADFDTYAQGPGTTVADVASGEAFARPHGGFAAVSNIGDEASWTGHILAQANLYGFGRLAWNPALAAKDIAREWAAMTFGPDPTVVGTVCSMLLASWKIYENYTAPLGVGWMVNPGHHYGPNVDGYEYSKWGTYHFADCRGIGVDRTVRSGTGYTAQYRSPHAERYESLEECPDELLLFFHHVPYTHRLKSGKTVIQHIYDSHFDGAEQAAELVKIWESLRGKVDDERHRLVLERLKEQAEHAIEWRDVINTYFYRKSGIPDEQARTIY
ncbi:alpha-glucuronidase family glycosyl hydrolase [Paenibacillus hamazuiensis]|uniref:alpha-glucuronidase family glycosyl hydrolase n=1 Tax=Paenibacillus hamazuiensis TaxID=2936508 RepID=UPI00200F6797|nr:alpha-glucuronidase family glycosyl hydrolase [Paenibacillus hamazuiensis]